MAEKKAYNQSIGKAHVDASRKCIVNYWQKYFDGDLQLVDLTREQLREFTIHLSKQKNTVGTRKNGNVMNLFHHVH